MVDLQCWHASVSLAVKISLLSPFPHLSPIIVDLRDIFSQQKAHTRPLKGPIPSTCLSSKSSRGPLAFLESYTLDEGQRPFAFRFYASKKPQASRVSHEACLHEGLHEGVKKGWARTQIWDLLFPDLLASTRTFYHKPLMLISYCNWMRGIKFSSGKVIRLQAIIQNHATDDISACD